MKRLLIRDRTALYQSLQEMVVGATESVGKPERLTVTQGAQKYVRIKEKNYSGPWTPDKTPYMVEPQNELMSLDYTGEVFVGPARTGKSQMFLNWMATTAICDPVDMMLVHMTQATGREWSLTDLAKLLRNSPDVRAKLLPGRQNDNVHDKTFLSGMRLSITWPTITNLSGKTIPRVWLMDYDRMPLNIDDEGDPWTLAKKRTQTYKRYGMTMAEASPGHPVEDPKWIPSAPHEAPPAKGILSLYNMGDRRRWYWECPSCHGKFEPDYKLFDIPASGDPMERSEGVTMICPHNGCVMTPDQQYELNLGGRWIKEGETWLEDGSIVGKARRSDIASFWLKGPAAAFTTWPELVLKVLNAEADYERTGDEEKLKSVTNTDLGLPYIYKALEAGRLPDELKQRAQAYNVRGEVPMGVRFLITTVDVQKGAFVCHTYGITPIQLDGGAWAVDIYHVDMWKITKSRRLDDDGHPYRLDPASRKEDWHILIDEVIEKKFLLSDGSGRYMTAKLVACDSGGAPSTTAARLNKALDGPTLSVTANAYDFWRYLKTEGRLYHQRFHLLKGEPSRTNPPLMHTLPDSQQKDKYAIARGDVPVWAVNSNVVKDQAHNMLGRTDPGGQVHFPKWYEESGQVEDIDWLYTQLTAETRLPAGWKNLARKKNEAFDLLAYCVAFLTHRDIKVDRIDWNRPPTWADEWDRNDNVFGAAGKPVIEVKSDRLSMSEIADILS